MNTNTSTIAAPAAVPGGRSDDGRCQTPLSSCCLATVCFNASGHSRPAFVADDEHLSDLAAHGTAVRCRRCKSTLRTTRPSVPPGSRRIAEPPGRTRSL